VGIFLADSLDLVEYIMLVEQVFKVEISDEDAEKLTTVGESQAYLAQYIRRRYEGQDSYTSAIAMRKNQENG